MHILSPRTFDSTKRMAHDVDEVGLWDGFSDASRGGRGNSLRSISVSLLQQLNTTLLPESGTDTGANNLEPHSESDGIPY